MLHNKYTRRINMYLTNVISISIFGKPFRIDQNTSIKVSKCMDYTMPDESSSMTPFEPFERNIAEKTRNISQKCEYYK